MKKTIISTIVVLLFFASCEEKFEDNQQNEFTHSDFLQEIAFPDKSGEVTTFEMKNGRILSYEKIDGFRVIEGDILLTDALVDFLKKEDTNTTNTFARVSSAPGALI